MRFLRHRGVGPEEQRLRVPGSWRGEGRRRAAARYRPDVQGRARWAALGAVAVLAVGAAGLGVKVARSLPYAPPARPAAHAASVRAELAYVDRWWRHPNAAVYGSFARTDCVNFTSQALLARGWPMTSEWGHSKTVIGTDAYAKPWVSSTAFARWLGAHPELARPVPDSDRGALSPGDVIQVDWDGSGDRDHTGVVDRITRADGRIAVDFAEHSPSTLHRSVDALLAAHPRAVVHYWHLLR